MCEKLLKHGMVTGDEIIKHGTFGKGETTKTWNTYSDGTSFIFYYHTMSI